MKNYATIPILIPHDAQKSGSIISRYARKIFQEPCSVKKNWWTSPKKESFLNGLG